MSTHGHISHLTDGFTVIEMVVSVFVASIFALSLIGVFTSFNYFTAAARQESVADNLTYNFLHKYTTADYPSSNWFNCDSNSGSANVNDRTVNPVAPGSLLEGGDLNGDTVGLPVPVSYTITAYAPYGCSDTNDAQSLMVVATVKYGKTVKVITHAAYASGI